MRIHIVTACSRPNNLGDLQRSILEARNPHGYDLLWWIVLDVDNCGAFWRDVLDPDLGPPRHLLKASCPLSVMGMGQMNWALDWIDEGLCHFLDDDNLFHPDLLDWRYEPGRAYLLNQQVDPSTVREPTPRVYEIDLAQILVDRSVIGTARFAQQYVADGRFIQELHDGAPERFAVVPGVRCFYNRLRWL